LFFCVPGFTRDGHDFAPDAVRRGASALVVERKLALEAPQVVVPEVRSAMALAAARFCGMPTLELPVVGITGTNGKTTTAFIIRALLEAAGRSCGLLGTVKSVVGGRDLEAQRTTPEAIDLQPVFRAMLEAGDDACAMEVSSHALELHRVDGIHFAVALFTNLTQDHLDFHPTMEAYFQAKRRLFEGTPDPPAVRIANVDDDGGRRLAEGYPDTVTFALQRPADYTATDVRTGLAGSDFALQTPDGSLQVHSPLPGRFNVANVLGAVAVVRALGVADAVIVDALQEAGRVPGRFEPVDAGQPFAVLVDYAHTPDGLENVLLAARELAGERAGRVICVFGCGGDRDRGKRTQMGAIAARWADRTIVTSDNPRSERPEAIITEILAGIAPGPLAGVESDLDRRRAIARAMELAEPGDVVLIAGKGHEQGQEFASGRKEPFDDVAVAREALRAVRT
nr:UDP-N-acetylmuramoyl-L-alanyl-D-glutamate--2,6-diaminopimelate ligase [Solirubrobacterales bacterium]